MGLKPGYKQTEVGVIPEEWDLTKLGDVFTLKSGFAFSSDFFSDTGPIVLTPGNFQLQGGLYFEERNTKRYSGPYDSSMTFNRGDLLIVMTDLTPECNLLGKPAFVTTEDIILHNQRIGKIVFKGKSADANYLFYMLLSRDYLDRIKGTATGSTVRHTSNKSIYDVPIRLPPLPEQRAIARALSDVDALIGALDQLIAKKRDLKQAAMQQLLTGKTRLPGFEKKKGSRQTEAGVIPEDWRVYTLGETCAFENGDRGKNYPSPASFARSGVPFLNAGHIAEGHINRSELNYITRESYDRLGSGKFRPGDILFCLRGSLGKFGIVPSDLGEGAIASSLVIVRSKSAGVSREFLGCYFKSDLCAQMIDKWSGGAAQPNLGAQDLARFVIPLPPACSEQCAIAEVLSDMDAELAALERRRDKTRALKQGMMQELLTGKTRLVGKPWSHE
jgi:type I restriction enzyme, S subunit